MSLHGNVILYFCLSCSLVRQVKKIWNSKTSLSEFELFYKVSADEKKGCNAYWSFANMNIGSDGSYVVISV